MSFQQGTLQQFKLQNISGSGSRAFADGQESGHRQSWMGASSPQQLLFTHGFSLSSTSELKKNLFFNVPGLF